MLADSEHVEVLRRGPRLWNDWRRQNPATVPNLIRLSLSAAERQMGIMNGGPVNLASARLMERLGMRREAHFHSNEYVKDEWCDELVYAILREEWVVR